MTLTHAEQVQNRYVRLGDAIAVLSVEAADLEKEMADGKYYPMNVQVYNGLKNAHEGVLSALHTLGQSTGVHVREDV